MCVVSRPAVYWTAKVPEHGISREKKKSLRIRVGSASGKVDLSSSSFNALASPTQISVEKSL